MRLKAGLRYEGTQSILFVAFKWPAREQFEGDTFQEPPPRKSSLRWRVCEVARANFGCWVIVPIAKLATAGRRRKKPLQTLCDKAGGDHGASQREMLGLKTPLPVDWHHVATGGTIANVCKSVRARRGRLIGFRQFRCPVAPRRRRSPRCSLGPTDFKRGHRRNVAHRLAHKDCPDKFGKQKLPGGFDCFRVSLTGRSPARFDVVNSRRWPTMAVSRCEKESKAGS